jgi:hypothetical protein
MFTSTIVPAARMTVFRSQPEATKTIGRIIVTVRNQAPEICIPHAARRAGGCDQRAHASMVVLRERP